MSAELNSEVNLVIQLRLIKKGDDKPVRGKSFKVRLYDQDVFNDDYLGESGVNAGLAVFSITQKDFKAPMGLDDKPDFYFVVYKDDKEIFKSKVMSNLEIRDVENFVMKEGNLIDLGTFLIDADE